MNFKNDPIPSDYIDARVFLKNLYLSRKTENGSYSYAKFASDLGFAASAIIHQTIHGKRTLTEKAGEKIVKSLNLNKTERLVFQTQVRHLNEKDPHKKEQLFHQLLNLKSKGRRFNQESKDELSYFSKWYITVVKELLAIESVSQNPADIAKLIQPRIRPKQVEESIEILSRLGLVKYDKTKNRYLIVKEIVDSRTLPGEQGLKRYHQAMMDMGKLATSALKESERSVTSVTVRMSHQQFREIKKEIYKMQTRILSNECRQDQTEMVCQMNVQLFPFTTDLNDKGAK